MLQVKELAYAVQINTVEGTDMADIWPEDLQKLLEQFEAVFKTPQGLPPNRSFDHHIPLFHPDQTISARPYKYP